MYICKNCLKEYKEDVNIWHCECGESLYLDFKPKFSKSDIDTNDFTMFRYSKLYPIKKEDITISLGEGLTPMNKIKYSGLDVFIKNESVMPTGSFKDRGIVMIINYLKNNGVKVITADSSGNAGCAIATYAKHANIDCNVYVSETTSKGKVAQILASGANLVKIKGIRTDVANAAQNSILGIYASHNYNPYFVEGVKSLAFEIWEQNNFKAPENVLVPIGNGSLVVSLYIGFKNLLDNNEIEFMPRIFAVQAENCNPIYREFHNLESQFTPLETVAEGIALPFSTKKKYVAEIIKETKGDIYSVNEEEILTALKEISNMGFFIEPTSASAFAGLTKLSNSGLVKKGETTVSLITGSGLKAADKVLHYLGI